MYIDTIVSFSEQSIDELIESLEIADDKYHNGDDCMVTDNQYDAAKKWALGIEPEHKYFTGVGSDIRGGKVPLPYTMGSLDQVYDGEIENWINKNTLEDEEVVITDKLDGISAMAVYDKNRKLQIAYSRGNGVLGADITRHVNKLIPGVLVSQMRSNVVIRGEIIISLENFTKAKLLKTTQGGKQYKNPRNMIAGLMNSKELDPALYDCISFVAYELVNIRLNKFDQLCFLRDNGFETAKSKEFKGNQLNDVLLTKHLNQQRDDSKYEIDGVVIDVKDSAKREQMNPTASTLNPAYSVKYKVATTENLKQATVIDVQWNTSKHGYLKPRVQIEPTELMGVTVQHATGFNAKYINEYKIGPGAVIEITRSGDVVPIILQVISPQTTDDSWFESKLSENGEWQWNDTGVDVVLTNAQDDKTAQFEQTVDFFASMDVPGLRKGNIAKLQSIGLCNIADIINATEEQFTSTIGKKGKDAFTGMHNKLSPVEPHVLFGSTTFFGRGVGKRKFKKLFAVIDSVEFLDKPVTTSMISCIDSFDDITANKIILGIPQYKEFYFKVYKHITFIEKTFTGNSLQDEKIVFTGFRDKDLERQVEENGGTMQSSVSGKTTILVAANPESTSGKIKKAKSNGTKVLGIEEFKQLL